MPFIICHCWFKSGLTLGFTSAQNWILLQVFDYVSCPLSLSIIYTGHMVIVINGQILKDDIEEFFIQSTNVRPVNLKGKLSNMMYF